jgi:nucleotide-binding universal stress UspA family protein
MIKKVMIAIDGSDTSKKAAGIGIDIARRANGTVVAVYVMDISRLSHLPGYATLPGLKEKILALIQDEGKQATEFVLNCSQNMSVPCRAIIAQGNPADELLKAAKEEKADLIVMGKVGRTAVEKFLLGSVAEKVVSQSTIPVILIKDNECA